MRIMSSASKEVRATNIPPPTRCLAPAPRYKLLSMEGTSHAAAASYAPAVAHGVTPWGGLPPLGTLDPHRDPIKPMAGPTTDYRAAPGA